MSRLEAKEDLFHQAILLWSLITFKAPSYGNIEYPTWGTAVGWCMIVLCMMWIPILAIIKIYRARGNFFAIKENLDMFGVYELVMTWRIIIAGQF
ncbi:unnamed protein product [Ranitomeya imitator]|uniref:Uncharacterized protein n=1 Tax=Ranitomeya imitator TaxID=111125 RepID=A0ABN9MBV1_9NEOB|nr:unnamed protein product [Ranitomeya imitator]